MCDFTLGSTWTVTYVRPQISRRPPRLWSCPFEVLPWCPALNLDKVYGILNHVLASVSLSTFAFGLKVGCPFKTKLRPGHTIIQEDKNTVFFKK